MMTGCTHKRIKVYLAAVLSLFIFAGPLYAAKQGAENISWGFLVIGILGGLALFLYGMEKMSNGMKKSA
ncbi:MAG: hypothetical protein JRF27_06480, partial [Deltaproteobacteria bacterium]|nr:hypothetical protein [Deltaproteobacteria bacterium]